jgi:carbonic anhydrase/acetyltransferase-like protein (isoleucine patch superfamily)
MQSTLAQRGRSRYVATRRARRVWWDPVVRALRIRLLQVLALHAPGAMSLRVRLHRWRGVRIGSRVFIGADALLETSRPELIWIGDRVVIGIRSTVIAHFRRSTAAERGEGTNAFSVRIEDDVFLGPGVIVLPGVTIGAGAVVAAGSVVTSSVQPLTMVQGNPARPVARCGVPLGLETPIEEFGRNLRPMRRSATRTRSAR